MAFEKSSKMTVSECIKNLIAVIICLIAAILIIPIFFGLKPFIVMSGSMSPAVKTGSLAYINTHTVQSEIKEGDIIAFESDGMIITHRVIEIRDGKFITKGDANNSFDSAEGIDAGIIGRMEYSVPLAGYLAYFIQTPLKIFRKET